MGRAPHDLRCGGRELRSRRGHRLRHRQSSRHVRAGCPRAPETHAITSCALHIARRVRRRSGCVVVMETGTLLVLTDGEPEDMALVRTAREYADANDCSVTLLRVLPEANRGYRTESGVEILPWQVMHHMAADAQLGLGRLGARFPGGRA